MKEIRKIIREILNEVLNEQKIYTSKRMTFSFKESEFEVIEPLSEELTKKYKFTGTLYYGDENSESGVLIVIKPSESPIKQYINERGKITTFTSEHELEPIKEFIEKNKGEYHTLINHLIKSHTETDFIKDIGLYDWDFKGY